MFTSYMHHIFLYTMLACMTNRSIRTCELRRLWTTLYIVRLIFWFVSWNTPYDIQSFPTVARVIYVRTVDKLLKYYAVHRKSSKNCSKFVFRSWPRVIRNVLPLTFSRYIFSRAYTTVIVFVSQPVQLTERRSPIRVRLCRMTYDAE